MTDEFELRKEAIKNMLPRLNKLKNDLKNRLKAEDLQNVCYFLSDCHDDFHDSFYLCSSMNNEKFWISDIMGESGILFYIKYGVMKKSPLISPKQFDDEFSETFINFILLELTNEFKDLCKINQLKKINNSIEKLNEKIDELIEEIKYSPNNSGRMEQRKDEFQEKALMLNN